MPKICYLPHAFSAPTLAIVEHANEMLAEYAADDLTVTLRQLYYQFVAKDLFPESYLVNGTKNNIRSYKKLQDIISNGRMAGLIDWESLEDRTRSLTSHNSWNSPADIVEAVANQYTENLWASQDTYVEVWVEKEALAGVIERACELYRTPWLACRGYISQSEAWRAGRRIRAAAAEGKSCKVIHLGDHDPSGIDMTRDNLERLQMFSDSADIEVNRIALNMNQVRQYNPPPNFAKETDSRHAGYVGIYGDESWELDALEPRTLVSLIQKTTKSYIDPKTWAKALANEQEAKKGLGLIHENYDEVKSFVEENFGDK